MACICGLRSVSIWITRLHDPLCLGLWREGGWRGLAFPALGALGEKVFLPSHWSRISGKDSDWPLRPAGQEEWLLPPLLWGELRSWQRLSQWAAAGPSLRLVDNQRSPEGFRPSPSNRNVTGTTDVVWNLLVATLKKKKKERKTKKKMCRTRNGEMEEKSY